MLQTEPLGDLGDVRMMLPVVVQTDQRQLMLENFAYENSD